MDTFFDPQTAVAAAFGLLLLALVPVGCVIYWRIFKRTIGSRGKVSVERMGFPELLVGFLLISMFLGLAALALHAEERQVRNADIVQGSVFYLFVVVAIAAFLQVRGRDVGELFGFRTLKAPQTLGRGIFLVLAAYPLMALVAVVAQVALGFRGEQQDVVIFFQEAAKDSDVARIATTFLMASILAPFAEEFIFRGFLYGVMKRYLGIVGAIVFTSALFAAVHMNLPSLPALFILAVCLCLAYEATGSLAVPMVMHATFNLTQLSFLYVLARIGA